MPILARACVISLLMVACTGAYADTYVITIESMRFNPASLTIKRGDRVVWENRDLFPHTASADTNAFDSDDLQAQASWAWVAEKPGDYAYRCTYHPTMTARLIVR